MFSKMMTWGFYGIVAVMVSASVFVVTSFAIGLINVDAKSMDGEQWIEISDTADGLSTLFVDKASIKLNITEKPATSLIAIRTKIVPKKKSKSPDEIIVAVTSAEACMKGSGPIFLGPITSPDKGERMDWEATRSTMVDFIAISLCNIGKQEVDRRARTTEI